MATVRHLGLFPFCVDTYPPKTNVNGEIITRNTGDFSEYPFQLPIYYATRMWWTVKHWKVSFDYYRYEPFDEGGYELIEDTVNVSTAEEILFTPDPNEQQSDSYNYDYVRSIEDGSYGLPTEKALVCVTNGNEYEPASRASLWQLYLYREILTSAGNLNIGTVGIGGVFYTNFDFFQYGFPAPFVSSETDREQNLLWTAFAFLWGLGWTSAVNRNGPTIDGTVKLLGLTRTLKLSRPPLPDNVTETISNLVIEPSEFWEYDPNDGLGPIYDKITGKQLRAFPDSSASASASVS